VDPGGPAGAVNLSGAFFFHEEGDLCILPLGAELEPLGQLEPVLPVVRFSRERSSQGQVGMIRLITSEQELETPFVLADDSRSKLSVVAARLAQAAVRVFPLLLVQAPEPGHFPAQTKVGRNEACPCRSGKKYKYCCGR
jgi:hypothetical protein